MRSCRSWQLLRRLSKCQWRAFATNEQRPFAVNDLVLLRQKNDRTASPLLSKPLTPGQRIVTHRGSIKHDDIIGKGVRDLVKATSSRPSSDGTEYRLHPVTLEDYARLSKRLVTPIYPADAGLIVSLLDLHPDPRPPPGAPGNNADDHDDDGRTLEILEAGTGHGALTLYLSRAIHAANFPGPPTPLTNLADDPDAAAAALAQWKSHRKALIHTIDLSPRFSAHARAVVQGFRHGLYAANVDFHVGDVSVWLSAQRRPAPFLSHAILDMPGADAHFGAVAAALVTDGALVAFNPSVTQIATAVKRVKDEGIPLELERVLELGVNGGSGGREWDLRLVRPRAQRMASAAEGEEGGEEAGVVITDAGSEGDGSSAGSDEGMAVGDQAMLEGKDARRESAGEWSMVCRPKVGERIIGGGFLGVWRKQRDMRSDPRSAEQVSDDEA